MICSTILDRKRGLLLISIWLIIQATGAVTYTVESGGNYPSIQRAIDAARDGDTIYVNSGLYYETVIITKRLTLIGRDTGKGSPIVDGMGRQEPLHIMANGVRVEGFVAQHSGTPCGQVGCAGIFLDKTSNVTVQGNTVRDNDLGIGLLKANGNNIINNVALNNAVCGINLNQASYNKISGNAIDGNQNYAPLYLGPSSNSNEITNNTITNSYSPTLGTDDSTGNLVYLNNILVKSPNIYMNQYSSISWISPNSISYTYLNTSFSAQLGNYWVNYKGIDANGDGIGDVPHPTGAYNEMDTHPLIGRWNGEAIGSTASPPPSPPPATPAHDTGMQYALPPVEQIILAALLLAGIVSIAIFLLGRRKAATVRGEVPDLASHKNAETVREEAPAPVSRAPGESQVPGERPHHDVFISYSQQDKPVADAVCSRLEVRSIRCWIAPRDVLPGKNYPEAIIDAIDESRIMILIFSSSSNTSPHVIRELTRAVGNGAVIIPFRIEDIQPSKAMAYLINLPHWLDALTPPLEKHIEKLVSTVDILLRRT